MASTNNPRLAIEITAMTDGLKKGLAEARAELKKFATEAGKSDYKTVLQQEKVAQAQARTEATQYRTEIAKLALEKKRGAQATQALSGSYREAQQRLTALGASIRNAQGGFTNTTPAIRAQITEYRKLNEQLKAFDKQMGLNYRNVGNYGDAFLDAIPGLNQFTSVVGLVGAGVAALNKSFTTNLKLDAINYSIKQVSGDATNFDKNMEFLRETSERLGLEFISTAEAFKSWQGSAQFANITSDESRRIFESVANAGAKMKLSADDVRGAFRALEQMMSKGKVQAEELRGQLGERLPGAFALAARAMGVTQQELNKMLETGQVVATDFLPRFATELDRSFGNDKTQKIESMQASVNRLSNEFTNLWQSDNATKFFTSVTNGLTEMTNRMNKLVNTGSWEEFWLRVSSLATAPIESLFGLNATGEEADKVRKAYEDVQRQVAKGGGNFFGLGNTQSITDYINTNKGLIKSTEEVSSVLIKNKDYWNSQVKSIKESRDALASSEVGSKKWIELTKQLNNAQKNLDLFGDNKRKTGSSGGKTKNGISDILNDLSGVGLNDYDAKIAKIRVEYEKLVKKIGESTGTRSKISEALGLAESDKDFKILQVNVNRTVDSLKYLVAEYTKLNNQSKRGVTLTGQMTIPGVGGLTAKNPFIKTTAKLTDEFTAQFKSTLRRGIADSLDGLFSNLSEWGNKTYEIEQKYNDLRRDASQEQINYLNEMERLEKRINSGITNTLSKLGSTLANLGGNLLSSAISSGISSGNFKDLGNMFSGKNKAQGYGALAGLVGSTLSGIIKPSNVTGQTLSGALSGAGTGAALGSIIPGIGTAIGAVGGALVGALSSLFGSSARKKQEELQEKQLAEQRKQTAMMERQAMLSYSSSVIAQQTNAGIVSSVERDAYGNLVATLKGSDIVLAIQREESKR